MVSTPALASSLDSEFTPSLPLPDHQYSSTQVLEYSRMKKFENPEDDSITCFPPVLLPDLSFLTSRLSVSHSLDKSLL